jgi:hypothetical protein
MHALLRDAQARDLLRCRRRRYNSGIGSSFRAVRSQQLTHLTAARDERDLGDTP